MVQMGYLGYTKPIDFGFTHFVKLFRSVVQGSFDTLNY